MTHLFIPGPVNVDPQVAQAQTSEMLPHRSAAFEELFQQVTASLCRLFATEARVFITASSGTGLQEAAVRNLAQGKVLSCVNGAFGKRWHEVALTNGKQSDLLEVAWNQPVTPEDIGAALQRERYDIITVVHNETSTGLVNPVREIAAAVQSVSPETLVCVDAVSSLGGVALEMDAWGLDVLLTSSQKCLALPPGLGLAGVSDRAMQRAESVPNRGWYFDFVRMEKHRLKDSTPATPAISLIYALDVQLQRIFAEGLAARFARHQALAERVQSWALGSGFALYAPEGYRSHTVTTVQNTRQIDVSALNASLQAQGMRIAGGYGALKGTTFRVGHMGETQMADVEGLLAAMEEFLEENS